ncbi:MAG TPA: glycosyl hydrolase [Candidatus Brocadiia bacterium]|nr:glycosyl hydrolase [Candidatus Brocadiia bacterium]
MRHAMKETLQSRSWLPGAAIPVMMSALLLPLLAAAEEHRELAPRFGNLNGRWAFRLDPGQTGEKDGWAAPILDDSAWQQILVPGLWEEQGVTGERDAKGNPPDGYNGVAWYRLKFIISADWKGKDLNLWLGRIDDEDRTYLNGRLVGETGPGIERAVMVNRFYSVKPEFVNFGRENVLAMRVRDGGGPGGIIGPSLSLLPAGAEETMMKKLPQENRPLSERFSNPPANARINKIIHNWPDSPDEQDYLISSLISRGFGGVTSNVSFQDYLVSEQKWQAFIRAVNKSKEVGMSLWLYDENGYPSGSAGGLVLKDHPEWQSHGLLIANAESDGGKVSIDVPPGTLVSAAAYPEKDGQADVAKAVDLKANIANGKLEWTAPAGRCRVVVVTQDVIYEGTHMSVCLAQHMPFIDYLIPEATQKFIELTHDAYAKRFGGDLGKYFVATFTDEPSLMSLFLKGMPYSVLPWAPNLQSEFRKRRGYDLDPLVPLLIMDAGGAEQKARHDYWLTIGEMVSENFFGQIQERCAKYNIPSGGHLLLEESVTAHVPLYGDFFRCIRRLDAPSIDCLTSIPAEVPWHVARLLSSAAELEGKTITMSETSDHCQRYRPEGDKRPVYTVSEAEIRGTCNRLILNGINTITSYYSFSGLDDDAMNRLNNWVGRCCTTLTGGHQVCDVALLYPSESLWTRFVPSAKWTESAKNAHDVESAYHAAERNLYEGRRDFTHVDSRTIAEAKVSDGSLVYRNLEWRVVVLPNADTMPLKSWRNLADFWKSGGVVVSIGVLPANSEAEFPSNEIRDIAKAIFGDGEGARAKKNAAGGVGVFLPRDSVNLLASILNALLEPDVKISDSATPIRVTHRRIDGHEIWFLINDGEKPVSCKADLSASGAGERLDPSMGTISQLPSGNDIALDLQPYGGMLFRFAKVARPKRLTPEVTVFPVKFSE